MQILSGTENDQDKPNSVLISMIESMMLVIGAGCVSEESIVSGVFRVADSVINEEVRNLPLGKVPYR